MTEQTFNLLNMSSGSAAAWDGTEADDRTTKARIRDAAIACIAKYGVAATTARKVATAAEVSPGLVIHHFGSMDGLRSACDEYLVATIRRQEEAAMSSGPGFDVLAALRGAKVEALSGYLARVLVDDAPAVANLVDDLVDDAVDYMQRGVESGMLQPTANPRGRAAVLVVWTMGALVLHQHVERILGVDLTDPAVGTDPAIASYAGPAYEILSRGIFSQAFGEQIQKTFAEIAVGDNSTEPATAREAEGSSTTEREGAP